MANFNRGSRPGGGRSFERRGFNDRGSRGPVQMHQAVCDKCRQNCEVPFRPTSGKPIYCSNCFEGNRGTDSRNFSSNVGPSSGREDRQMFEAICDECRNTCKVPFQPSGGKPVYCSNCFGEKKGAGDRNNGCSESQCKEQFVELNNKLDKILSMLAPKEAVVTVEEKTKVIKKKPSNKK